MALITINSTLKMYIQEAGEIPALINNDWKVTKTLSNITTEGSNTTVVAKINASFFINDGGSQQGQILGRYQGIKSNFTRVDEVPDQAPGKKFYNVVITYDQSMHIGLYGSGDFRDNAQVGFAVPRVLVYEFQNRDDMISTEISCPTSSNYYTFFGRLEDNRFFMACSSGRTPVAARQAIQDAGYSLQHLVQLDGGGSTQMNVNGQVVFNDSSERLIPNALVFYIDNSQPPTPAPVDPQPFPANAVFNLKINVGGAVKDFSEGRINVGGAAKEIAAVVVNVGGVPKQAWRYGVSVADFPGQYGAYQSSRGGAPNYGGTYTGGCSAIEASAYQQSHSTHNPTGANSAFNNAHNWDDSWKVESGTTNSIWFKWSGQLALTGVRIWGPGMGHEQSGYQPTSFAIDLSRDGSNWTETYSSGIPTISSGSPASYSFAQREPYQYLRLRLSGNACLVSEVKFSGTYYPAIGGLGHTDNDF